MFHLSWPTFFGGTVTITTKINLLARRGGGNLGGQCPLCPLATPLSKALTKPSQTSPFPFYSIVKYCFACKRHLYPSWGKLELMGRVTPPPHYRRVGRDSRFWSLGNDWIWWINLLFYTYDSIRHVMYRAATWRLLSYKNSLTNP